MPRAITEKWDSTDVQVTKILLFSIEKAVLPLNSTGIQVFCFQEGFWYTRGILPGAGVLPLEGELQAQKKSIAAEVLRSGNHTPDILRERS